MMAEIALHGAKESIDSRGYISIQDPTLGAGVMLIAAAHVLSSTLKDGRNWQNHTLFVGQEVSTVAAQMAYIQLSLLGCAGYIKIGNSLTSPMEAGDCLEDYWFTPMYFGSVWQTRRALNPSGILIDPYKK